MRQPLEKSLRKKLEYTVIKAREIVDVAVAEALQRLGVADGQAPSYLSEEQRALRNTLRAHARQLGDKLIDGKQEIERLANEMAYEHWHRMLFARYLEQNNLLMYDEHTPVTLEECFELAEEESDCKDGWELAGRLAQKMLPQIFRADSPVFKVKLSVNRVNELEELIAKLDPATYQAQDSLGWCYQFWQTKKKEQVNKSGVKIGAQELSPVTQLFTEPYMVSFLLDNALGAWWANKRLTQDDYIRANNEQELREKAAIPGVPLEYLRFIKNEENGQWQPAAGGFEKWPEQLSELKTLDPCCGSGHFLVAVFLMLVPMRMQLEGLSAKEAVDAVLRDNIHGLELDQRCVELAAFAIALEAWRYPNAGGYRALPELQLACSGMSIEEAQKEWKELAKGDEELTEAITWMQHTFKDAPTLGSLIDPTRALKEEQTPPCQLLQQAMVNESTASSEIRATAQGLAKASDLLSLKYDYVLTNPPYLGEKKQSEILRKHIVKWFNAGRADLATAFLIRIDDLLNNSGYQSLVVPQNWLYQRSYIDLRAFLLNSSKISLINQLGSNAFDQSVGADVLLIGLQKENLGGESFFGKDLTSYENIEHKREHSKHAILRPLKFAQLMTDDFRIVLSERNLKLDTLSKYSNCYAGVLNGDTPRFVSSFWEVSNQNFPKWEFFQRTVSTGCHSGGRSNIILWESGNGQLRKLAVELKEKLHDADRRGNQVWGKKGIVISQMGELASTLYTGELYDQSVGVISPNNDQLLLPIWAYCSSPDYNYDVRKIDKNKKVTVATLIKTQFDLEHWTKVAKEKYPNGLPQPYSDDSTQWIFHGHPCASVIWDETTKTTAIGELRHDDTVLQVTVARLLGYQWPAELDPEMELAPEMRQVMLKNADFSELVDDDGIVCIPAVRGEKTAAKRLADVLYKAYGTAWSSSVEDKLLKAVKAKDWESWLRDKFFEQHLQTFQQRPFIWQIWDGLKDGFSVLVNYHKLDYQGLERLIYTYLDDWISTQKRELADGVDGADIRLIAAENLKVQLEAILEGEKGLDIFVRWKPLEQQPIGWNPDLNDGVRLNIRPFMLAKDVGKKGAGVLRSAPKINWNKDRGSDVESAPWYHLGVEYGGNEGDRINEHHLTLAEKKAAREQAQ
ncbi:Eco57I restriction-modification methylase domain-containing protein [Shewanella xiamenensis]|uniref:Eco57I restriction-modification methylase domain-containing protein n=1 Tax=Shewanella xiamenensis TaxID=332186 RepID=UPI002E7C4B51|nr:DNA methyltransferase [Shewanella xiamenensis]MEE1982157.1 DNA methyltransferase [Shewanella xiamenensis]